MSDWQDATDPVPRPEYKGRKGVDAQRRIAQERRIKHRQLSTPDAVPAFFVEPDFDEMGA